MKNYFLYHKNANFGLVQLFYWMSNCTAFGFLVAFLLDAGYSNTITGLTTTLLAVTAIIAQPIIGYICDTYLTSKMFLSISILTSIPIVLAIPFVVHIKPLTVSLLMALSVLDCTRSGAIDTWSVKLRDKYPEISFPLTRAMGSIGYGGLALLIGFVIPVTGFSVLYFTHAVFIFLMFFFITFLEPIPCANKSSDMTNENSTFASPDVSPDVSKEEKISFFSAVKMLIRNKRYMIFVIAAFFYNYGTRMIKGFLPSIITDRGGVASHLGIAIFIASFFEFPIIILFAKLSRRIKLNKIFLAAMVIGFIRILSINLIGGVWSVIFMQILFAVSFGLYLPLFVEYIIRIVPPKVSITALTIGNAVSASLGGIIGNVVSGVVIDRFGVRAFVDINIVCIGLSVLIYSLSFIVKKDKF